MNFWLQLCFVIFCVFIPITLSDGVPIFSPLPDTKIPPNLLLLEKDPSEGWKILKRTQDSLWEAHPLLFPFIDYDQQGSILNYNDNGDFLLFDAQHSLNFSKEEKKNAPLLPKMAYPFLLSLDKHRDFAKISLIQNSNLIPLTQYAFSNIVTSYKASSNGRYLVVSTLSNDLIIFDIQKHFQNPKTIHLDLSHAGVYAVGITDEGVYFALASHEPSVFVYGNVDSADDFSQIELSGPIIAQSQQFFQTQDLIFARRNHSWETFQIHRKTISSHFISFLRPYPLAAVKSLTNNRLALLYRLSPAEYILDLIDIRAKHFLKKIHLMTHSIPVFSTLLESKKSRTILVYDSGAWVIL